MQRPYRLRVRPVQLLTPLAAHPNQPHVTQHPQVLRDRRLLQPQRRHNLSNRSLCSSEITQNLPPPGLSHRVECIRRCARSRHDENITCRYRNMSSTYSRSSWSFFHPKEHRHLDRRRRTCRRSGETPVFRSCCCRCICICLKTPTGQSNPFQILSPCTLNPVPPTDSHLTSHHPKKQYPQVRILV